MFFSPHPPPTHPSPPPYFFPHLQHTFTLPSFNFSPPHPPPLTTSLSSFFSSLSLPREKRFCLLLVSAPSQSAFLISSYCFCLIFKCYPRPNGNPYRKKKAGSERGGKRNRLGIVFHSRTLRQSPPAPLRERFGWFWEWGGWMGEESWGWRMGLKYNPKGVTYFCAVSAPRTTLQSFLSHFLFIS